MENKIDIIVKLFAELSEAEKNECASRLLPLGKYKEETFLDQIDWRTIQQYMYSNLNSDEIEEMLNEIR